MLTRIYTACREGFEDCWNLAIPARKIGSWLFILAERRVLHFVA